MICYRDMTFCPYHEQCQDSCELALTTQVYKQACKWWGSKLPPIAQYADKPGCFKEKRE